jgi:hypothetical protein
MRTLRLLAAGLVFVVLAGCMNYYQVTDSVNGTNYYTKSLKDQKSGAVVFKDDSTGAKVLLVNYRVKEISRAEYKEGAR